MQQFDRVISKLSIKLLIADGKPILKEYASERNDFLAPSTFTVCPNSCEGSIGAFGDKYWETSRQVLPRHEKEQRIGCVGVSELCVASVEGKGNCQLVLEQHTFTINFHAFTI